MNGQMMNYKASMECDTRPIFLEELTPIRIDYKGLLKYAKEKGVAVINLSDSEKDLFIHNI